MSTTTGFVRAAARSADRNARASPTLSTYSRMPSVTGSCTSASSSSPKPTSMPPPSETTVEKPICIGAAKSSIAVHTAPDCATSARRPGNAVGAQNVALRPMSVRTTPNAPGPTRRTPRLRATAATSRRQFVPTAGSSVSGSDMRAAVRSRAFGSARMPATADGGAAMIARSTGLPIAPSVANARRPKTLRWFGLTAYSSPVKAPASRFS